MPQDCCYDMNITVPPLNCLVLFWIAQRSNGFYELAILSLTTIFLCNFSLKSYRLDTPYYFPTIPCYFIVYLSTSLPLVPFWSLVIHVFLTGSIPRLPPCSHVRNAMRTFYIVTELSQGPLDHVNMLLLPAVSRADPGLRIGGGADPLGGANMRFCQIFPKTA